MYYRLYFGRNIPNTLFSVSIDQIRKFLREFQSLQGYTLIPTYGMWLREEEESVILDLINADRSLAIAIKERYQNQFHQDYVMLVILDDPNEVFDDE